MNKQKNNKKADVQMVSYVVLIVISLSLSVLVYSFLKSKTCIFSCKEKCPEEVSVIIENVVCENGKLNITISNRGLFNVSMLFIRLGNESRKVITQVDVGREVLGTPLAPGDTIIYLKNYTDENVPSAGDYRVEVQPAVFVEKRSIALCNNVVAQRVHCTIEPET